MDSFDPEDMKKQKWLLNLQDSFDDGEDIGLPKEASSTPPVDASAAMGLGARTKQTYRPTQFKTDSKAIPDAPETPDWKQYLIGKYQLDRSGIDQARKDGDTRRNIADTTETLANALLGSREKGYAKVGGWNQVSDGSRINTKSDPLNLDSLRKDADRGESRAYADYNDAKDTEKVNRDDTRQAMGSARDEREKLYAHLMDKYKIGNANQQFADKMNQSSQFHADDMNAKTAHDDVLLTAAGLKGQGGSGKDLDNLIKGLDEQKASGRSPLGQLVNRANAVSQVKPFMDKEQLTTQDLAVLGEALLRMEAGTQGSEGRLKHLGINGGVEGLKAQMQQWASGGPQKLSPQVSHAWQDYLRDMSAREEATIGPMLQAESEKQKKAFMIAHPGIPAEQVNGIFDTYTGDRQKKLQESAAATHGGPKPGDVEDGHQFLGGDPGDQNNWRAVK